MKYILYVLSATFFRWSMRNFPIIRPKNYCGCKRPHTVTITEQFSAVLKEYGELEVIGGRWCHESKESGK